MNMPERNEEQQQSTAANRPHVTVTRRPVPPLKVGDTKDNVPVPFGTMCLAKTKRRPEAAREL